MGADFVRDRYAFERPPDRWQFDCAVATGVEVCVDPDVGAHEVRVEPGRWPRRGLRVYVDGKRWGLRGYEPGLG